MFKRNKSIFYLADVAKKLKRVRKRKTKVQKMQANCFCFDR